MDSKCLRPQVFDPGVNASNSARKWKHWKKMFDNYVARINKVTDQDKLDILISLLDTSVYGYISECETFDTKPRLTLRWLG